jgi:hypothetical protein
MYKVTGTRAAMFKNDMVMMCATGTVTPYAPGGRVGAIGSVVGLLDSNKLPTTYIADAGNGYAIVCDDPSQLYLVQEDLTGATLGLADVGQNLDGISTHSGNTSTGVSKMEIDSSDKTIDQHAAFKILGCHPEDKLVSAANHYRRWIVALNIPVTQGGAASGV